MGSLSLIYENSALAICHTALLGLDDARAVRTYGAWAVFFGNSTAAACSLRHTTVQNIWLLGLLMMNTFLIILEVQVKNLQ